MKISLGGSHEGNKQRKEDVLVSPPPLSVKCANKLQQVDLECLHHFWVSPPLNLHSWNDKVPFLGPHHLPKILGQKGKRNQLG